MRSPAFRLRSASFSPKPFTNSLTHAGAAPPALPTVNGTVQSKSGASPAATSMTGAGGAMSASALPSSSACFTSVALSPTPA